MFTKAKRFIFVLEKLSGNVLEYFVFSYKTNTVRKIRIASRASKLALVQANYIRTRIQDFCPEQEVSIVRVSTKGDRDKSDFLYKSGSTGFFAGEVENALIEGKTEIAVHSLKDLPITTRPELFTAAIPERESPADALVSSKGVSCISDLAAGSMVGTSSLRRMAQLRHVRSDLECVPLRGNVETRVSKVVNGEVDAAIVARAGLNRLDMKDKISAVLEPSEFVPAPGQGALAVQIRVGDDELYRIVSQLDDRETRIATEVERDVLVAMQGGCSIPLGVYAQIDSDTITIYAMLSDVEGKQYIKISKTGPVSEVKAVAGIVVDELLGNGAKEIIAQVRRDR